MGNRNIFWSRKAFRRYFCAIEIERISDMKHCSKAETMNIHIAYISNAVATAPSGRRSSSSQGLELHLVIDGYMT